MSEKKFSNKEAHRWIDSQLKQMCKAIISLADINTHAFNLEGMLSATDVLMALFEPLQAEVEKIPSAPFEMINDQSNMEEKDLAPTLVFRKRPKAKQRILLTGHLDTVFEPTHDFQQVHIEDQKMHGPGVTDMKGGLVMMLYALQALEMSPHADSIGWDVIINTDEEIGSPCSNAVIEAYAEKHELAMVFEPALDEHGTLASARKGSGKATVTFLGKSAHVGRNFHEGRSAILACMEFCQEVHKLNQEDLIVNVGYMHGGDAPNRVPDHAHAIIDIRFNRDEQLSNFKDDFNAVTLSGDWLDDGIGIEIYSRFNRPSKKFDKQDEVIYQKVKTIANTLHQKISWVPTGGCCDGNNIRAKGCRVIDTLGVCGANIHSDREYLLIDKLTSRCKLIFEIMTHHALGKLT